MSKIKVSKEVALALDNALKICSKEDFFEQHVCKMQWRLDVYLPLNQISNWEMAQILINGYEVKETPEEKLLELYNFNDWNSVNGKECKIIKETLKILNIKIKGIND